MSNCSASFLKPDVLRARLLDDDNNEVLSRDVSMCFSDAMPYDTLAEGIGRTDFQYTCDEREGISAGWKHAYRINLSCQWLDITDIDNGEYTLSLEINWNNFIDEEDHSNNIATKRVLISDQATVYTAPSNDDIENAIEIELGLGEGQLGTVFGASLSDIEDGVLTQCLENYSGMVWYRLTGTGGNLTASVCHPDSTLDSIVAVFHATNDETEEDELAAGFECVISQDDAPMCGLLSWVTWESIEDDIYYLAVGSFEIPEVYEWRGRFRLTVFQGEMPIEN